MDKNQGLTKDLYNCIYLLENIYLQSNLDGYYTKRFQAMPQEILICTHNHRKIGISELIFDIDCHVPSISSEISDGISVNLQKENVPHTVWDTSRSCHIHCFIEGLNLWTKETRTLIKKLLLIHFSGNFRQWIDLSRASENNMIRDFNCLHEITGKRKTLIYEYVAPRIYLDNLKPLFFSRLYNSLNCVEYREFRQETVQHNDNYAGFLDYCLNTRFDNQGIRNSLLFKNIAIALYRLGYTDIEIKEFSKKISLNCRGVLPKEVYGWMPWLRRKKNVHVNWKEVAYFGFDIKQHAVKSI